MSIFLTSDLHFGHRNILKLGKGRPFSTIEEHDQALIDNWNAVVKSGDLVYLLGDVSIETDADSIKDKLLRLNGNIHLVLGNHDRKKVFSSLLKENVIQSMREYLTIKETMPDGILAFFRLFHMPILEYDGAFKNYRTKEQYIHCYGHIHDTNNYDDLYKSLGFLAVHIGVDTSDTFPNTKPYSPIRLEDVYTKAMTFKQNTTKKEK